MKAGNRGNPLEGGVDWELGLEALLRSASALLPQGSLEAPLNGQDDGDFIAFGTEHS